MSDYERQNNLNKIFLFFTFFRCIFPSLTLPVVYLFTNQARHLFIFAQFACFVFPDHNAATHHIICQRVAPLTDDVAVLHLHELIVVAFILIDEPQNTFAKPINVDPAITIPNTILVAGHIDQVGRLGCLIGHSVS